MSRRTKKLTLCRRFTLIEMLVVIMIISVLAALLMPALRESIDTARGVLCQNNFKQIGYAIFTFADSNNGRCVGRGYKLWVNGSANWQKILNETVLKKEQQIPQMGRPIDGMLACPNSDYVQGTYRSLNMNDGLCSSNNEVVSDKSSWPAPPYANAPDAKYELGAMLSRNKRPSKFISVIDADSAGGDVFTPYHADTGCYYTSMWALSQSPLSNSANRVGGFAFRHSASLKCSELFLDGHSAMVDAIPENFTKENFNFK